MTIQMTIIGLGRVGGSIGLALAGQKQDIQRVGHDRSTDTMRQAEKAGAVNKSAQNLHNAVDKADLVILAIPLDEVRSTLEQIAGDLKEGAVVMSTCPAMGTVSAWAKELLPAERHFVPLYPSLNPDYLLDAGCGFSTAHKDLFQRSLMAIAAPAGADPDAIRLASDLSVLLGATPYFTDAAEFDGLNAWTEQLPRLAAAALVLTTTTQPGWTEARKIAGRDFAGQSVPVQDLPEYKAYGQAALLNRENVVRVLDYFITSLQSLRNSLETGNAEEVQTLLENASAERNTWLRQRQTRDWGRVVEAPPLPTQGEIFGRLLGLRPKKK